ncbi:unnamed protein product, partial [Phaeothamnion confervicola]
PLSFLFAARSIFSFGLPFGSYRSFVCLVTCLVVHSFYQLQMEAVCGLVSVRAFPSSADVASGCLVEAWQATVRLSPPSVVAVAAARSHCRRLHCPPARRPPFTAGNAW